MADNNRQTAQSTFIAGIDDFSKNDSLESFSFARNVDIRSDKRSITLNPKSAKESGSTIQGLVKWMDRVGDTVYMYDDTGKIYSRDSSATYSLMSTVSDSQGNGLAYFGEDDFLYYSTNTTLGRYGQVTLNSAPAFVDDFLGAEGGVPLNTYSLDLESGSSQYGTAADSASLSITSDLTLEAWIKPESLPTSGNLMTLIGKWDESGTTKSYRFSIATTSNFFGDGSDGSLTISSNTTEAPIDSACTGTSGAYTLSATNASFAAGQYVLIHQTRGTGAGGYQINKIESYTSGTITLRDALNMSYVTGAQVRVMKQYTDVTIDASKTYTAKAWDGTVGGILAFFANGTLTVNGTITATGKGFRGGSATASASYTKGKQGESYTGTWDTVSSSASAGGGGGGGGSSTAGDGGVGTGGGGGAGASSGTNGSDGQGGPVNSNQTLGGKGGSSYGSADLTASIFFGSGGGGGSTSYNTTTDGGHGGYGGPGGGILLLAAPTVTLGASGSVAANGGAGEIANLKHACGSGGSGGGGSVLIYAQTATLGTNQVDASTGAYGYNTNGFAIPGGKGGYGRVHIDYLTSYTGTGVALEWGGDPNNTAQSSARGSTSIFYATEDAELSSSVGYSLQLALSSDGSTTTTMSKPADIVTGSWQHVAVVWDSGAGGGTFYLNGQSLGSVDTALSAIHNNASVLVIGAYINSGAAKTAFFDGKIDEIRIWATERTEAQLQNNAYTEISTTSANLAAYYQLDNAATDSTANANDLTLTGSPVYSTDVPFSSPTTRLDIDQQDTSTGSTTALATSISEAASGRQTFVPTKEPLKSISVNISDTGDDSDWTLTIHDALNRTIASKTVTHANLNTGVFEFVLSSPIRLLLGASYHWHLTATTTTGTPLIVSGSSNNFETAQFKSYFQFLISDEYHPLLPFASTLAIGNERYLATWDGATYNPHRLSFPAGYRVRCLAKWKEYIAIGVTRGTNITDWDQGAIFFWDGTSDIYNFYIDVPEGGVNAMQGSRGLLHVIAGYQGDHLVYTGGEGAIKVKRIPKITKDKYVEVLPSAITMWQALLRYGTGTTDSSLIEHGIYTYGAVKQDQPAALSCDYTLSTGSATGTSIKIGSLFPYNKSLLVSWKDGVSYGVDIIDPSAAPFASGYIEFAIRDEGGVWKEKRVETFRADFKPLVSGETVRLRYKLDRASSWTYGDVENTAFETKARLSVPVGRHREYQVGVDLATSTTTSPTLLSIVADEDLLEEEDNV